jgi:hypothetical protein
MTRLARRLVSSRLQDSEFRWIEGDAAGRARRLSFPLGHVPPDVPAVRHAEFRDAFMTLARWVPDYFETRAGFRPLGIDTDAFATDEEWAIAAFHSNRDDRPGSGGRIELTDRFSFVHVMVFQSPIDDSRGTAAKAAERLGRLRAGLRLGYRRRRHVSVTYVPGTSDRDTGTWHFGSDADPYRPLTPLTPDDGAALARALQSSWLDRLTKDIWHG